VISRSGVVISITNCYIRLTLLYFTDKSRIGNCGYDRAWVMANQRTGWAGVCRRCGACAHVIRRGYRPHVGVASHVSPMSIVISAHLRQHLVLSGRPAGHRRRRRDAAGSNRARRNLNRVRTLTRRCRTLRRLRATLPDTTHRNMMT